MIQSLLFIIDDEQSIRDSITLSFEDDYQVNAFSCAEDALDVMQQILPDLILLDIGLPGMNGIEALEKIKKLSPETVVIMITAYEDVPTVIAAMKHGAYDYVVKPLYMDSLEASVRNGLETVKLRKEVKMLQEKFLQESIPCFVGQSKSILDVMEFVGTVAKSPDTPILILGETGTGKELIASAIHYRSPNFKGPFITVNCPAIPKDLVESELFGYEKGGFSGARSTGKKGLFEEADGGTLFLDEVGDLDLAVQGKILRFLETGEFFRVGGTKKEKVSARVVSATNKDLQVMVHEKTFRNDLYFRLGVIKVQIPSLRERPADILPLAKHFLHEFNQKFGKDIITFTPQAEELLLNHDWSGNVRELKNIIERGVLIADGSELSAQNLDLGAGTDPKASLPPDLPPLSPQGINLTAAKRNLESFYITQALKMAGGNESQAARLLNMNHHTFRYRKKILQVE